MLNQESNELKKDFPIFLKEDFTYLDTSATSQKPSIVIDSINEYYRNFNANAGRGSYELSIMSKSIIENINSNTYLEIVHSGFQYIAYWRPQKSRFICVEPWFGITDNINHDKKLENKSYFKKVYIV